MGADLLLTYAALPHDERGIILDLTDEVEAILKERINTLTADDVIRAYEAAYGAVPSEIRYGDDDAPTEDASDEEWATFDIKIAREVALGDIHDMVDAMDWRNVIVVHCGGVPYLFTGGTSWGETDDPWNSVVMIANLGVTQEAITLS